MTSDERTITNPSTLHDPTSFGYSHAVSAPGEIVHIAGQYASDASGAPVPGDFATQVELAFDRLRSALEAVGLDVRRERDGVLGGAAVRQVFFRLGEVVLEVVGTFNRGALINASYVMSMPDFTSNVTGSLDGAILLKMATGLRPEQAQPLIEAALADYPNVTVNTPDDITRNAQASVNQLLGIVTALLLLAVVVAVLGIVNTLVADPVKFLLKEDVTPAGADRFLHFLAPIIAVVPVVAAFAVIPFGDVLEAGGRVITLQAAQLNVGVLYVLAMAALGVYGVVLAGWASNNRWSLLGGIRGSAQMISYEIAMGLALIGVVLTYGTLDLQSMVRQQGALLWGWLPAWGIFYQPFAFVLFLVAGVAESKRIPFDLPESESELVSGYFTEYSGAKHLMFMMADFVEVVLVSALVTTFFFGGWQVPFLARDGFHVAGQVYALPAAWIWAAT